MGRTEGHRNQRFNKGEFFMDIDSDIDKLTPLCFVLHIEFDFYDYLIQI